MWTSKLKRCLKVKTSVNIGAISLLLLSPPSLVQQPNMSYLHSQLIYIYIIIATKSPKLSAAAEHVLLAFPTYIYISLLLLSPPSLVQQPNMSYLGDLVAISLLLLSPPSLVQQPNMSYLHSQLIYIYHYCY